MKELLAKLLERKNLSQEEAREMILWVMVKKRFLHRQLGATASVLANCSAQAKACND